MLLVNQNNAVDAKSVNASLIALKNQADKLNRQIVALEKSIKSLDGSKADEKDLSNYYTKDEVYNKNETYNKTEVYNKQSVDNQISGALANYEFTEALGNTQSSNTHKGRWYKVGLTKGSYFPTIDGSMYDRCYFNVILIDSGGLSEYTIMFRDTKTVQIYGLNYKVTNPKLEAIVQGGELYIHPLTRWGCNWYIKGFGSRPLKLNVTVFDNEFSIEGVKPSSLTSDIVKADYGITESDLGNYEVKNAKVIKLKNSNNYPICYKLGNIGSTTQLNLLYIASRVNGYSKIKGTGVYNKQISNLLGSASTINEWNTYIIVDDTNNVYIVISSFSEVTILNSCYSSTDNLIAPTLVGSIPNYVNHD